jgi:hypothetical protein
MRNQFYLAFDPPSAQRDGLENVGSALNSTSKENINKVVALLQSTNFGMSACGTKRTSQPD